jgi:hypothetical protein
MQLNRRAPSTPNLSPGPKTKFFMQREPARPLFRIALNPIHLGTHFRSFNNRPQSSSWSAQGDRQQVAYSKLWQRAVPSLRLLCAFAWLALPALAIASEYHGQVTLNGLPVSGASVSAAQGEKRSIAITDDTGFYSFPDLADGLWTIQVDMTGFAPIKQEVTIAPNAVAGKWELKMLSLDQLRAAAKPVKITAEPPPVQTATTTGPQSNPAGASKTPIPAKPQAGKAGAPTETAAAPEPPPSEGLLINGSVNNAATSQFALAPAFGNTRSGGRNLYTGGLTLILANSALDAKSFTFGQDLPKPSFNNLTGNATLLGPIRIPHLLPRGPNFSINYQWVRNSSASTSTVLVPTLAERNGDFSSVLNSSGQPVQIVNPATGLPFTGNVPISAQAAYFLNQSSPAHFPLPNLTGDPAYNYQTVLVSDTHQDAMQMRLNKSIGQRNNFYGGFAFQDSRTSGANLFGFVDTNDSLGLNTNVSWQHRFKQRLFMTVTYNFSRSRNQSRPFFQNRVNIEALAGIGGTATTSASPDPGDWGPPNLSFSSSGIAGMSDANSSYNRNEANAVSYDSTWNHLRHNFHYGADFRRIESNFLAQANPRGSFSFTGAATALNGSTTSGTGYDFADFLLGLPDTSAIAYGNADKYLRQSVYDAFLLDDWRVRPDLTINAGVRWEYGAPITELFGRLVNLDVASGFTAVSPVLGSSPTGALTGQSYPTSLVRPDKSGIAPVIGVSWRPISGSSILVKAGYQIAHDTSVYQSTAQSMDQQAPLSKSLSVSNSAACPLTLANAFNPCSTTTATTFGVDPNFRVGYVQTWQLSVQRDLPAALQGTVTYIGIKGTRGPQQFFPNTYPSGAANPCPSCPSGYTYRTSNGNSTREAGSIQLRRRLRAGFTSTLTYTYSKSIDDDSFLGGGGPISAGATSQSVGAGTTAQNWLNLRGERGLSTFDQRHLLNISPIQYTTGMGMGGRSLMSGWRGRFYKEWTVVANLSVGTGTPETPVYIETLSGAACTNCVRPNVTGASTHAAPPGYYVNAAAFSAPAAGQFGNARVGSITGPDHFSFSASAARTFRLHDRYNLDIRIDSNNTLNHVTYSSYYSTINSTQFGAPGPANAMRTASFTMRLRF